MAAVCAKCIQAGPQSPVCLRVSSAVDTACLSLLSLAVSKAEDDIIPHAGKLGAALVGRCVEEIESGVDITETPTLESLVNITNVRVLTGVWYCHLVCAMC